MADDEELVFADVTGSMSMIAASPAPRNSSVRRKCIKLSTNDSQHHCTENEHICSVYVEYTCS